MTTMTRKYYDWVLQIITLAMTFLVPLAFYLRTYDSCMVKISILHVGGSILFCWLLIKFWEERRINIPAVLYLPVLAFLVSGLSAFFLSSYRAISYFELLRRSFYIIIFFVTITVFNDEGRTKQLFQWIMLASFLSIFYGFIQLVDLDPYVWRRAFGPRIFSTFGNPNFWAAFLVLSSFITSAYLMMKGWKIWQVGLVFLGYGFFLYNTQTKASWIGFAFGLIFFTFLVAIFFLKTKPKNLKLFLVLFSVGVIMLTSFALNYFVRQRVDSVRFRIFTWLSTWEMVEKHPFIGGGLGTFMPVYPLYRRPEIFHIEGKHNTETDHPENEYLEIWYDEGVIGFGIFLWVILTYFTGGLKELNRLRKLSFPVQEGRKKEIIFPARSYYLLGLLGGLFGFLAHNLMCVNLRFVSSGFFLWLVLGLLGRQIIGYGYAPVQEKPAPKPVLKKKPAPYLSYALAVFSVITAWFFSRYFWADQYHNIAIAYSKAGRWPEALHYYNEVIKRNPYFPMSHYFMGNVYNDRWEPGDFERALEKYGDLKKIAPNYVQVHYQEGVVYTKQAEELRQKGDLTESQSTYYKAVEDFFKALDLDPVFPHGYFKLGWIFVQLKQWPLALWSFQEAVNRSPKFIEAYLNLGNLYFMMRNYPEAEKTYLAALKIEENKTGLRNLALLYEQNGRLPQAVPLWQRILKIEPNDPEAQSRLGVRK